MLVVADVIVVVLVVIGVADVVIVVVVVVVVVVLVVLIVVVGVVVVVVVVVVKVVSVLVLFVVVVAVFTGAVGVVMVIVVIVVVGVPVLVAVVVIVVVLADVVVIVIVVVVVRSNCRYCTQSSRISRNNRSRAIIIGAPQLLRHASGSNISCCAVGKYNNNALRGYQSPSYGFNVWSVCMCAVQCRLMDQAVVAPPSPPAANRWPDGKLGSGSDGPEQERISRGRVCTELPGRATEGGPLPNCLCAQ